MKHSKIDEKYTTNPVNELLDLYRNDEASSRVLAQGYRLRMRARLAHYPKPIRAAGFTLIELSIGIIVIGLLVGGVLVGQDLIAISMARSQVSQMEKVQIAVTTFKLKYNCLPGDCDSTDSFGLGTSGNGNKRIEVLPTEWGGNFYSMHGNASGGERQAFWVHLGAAQLIDGEYQEYTGSTKTFDEMKAFYPMDALGKTFIAPVDINGKTYIINGITGADLYRKLLFGNNAITTSQMNYIQKSQGNADIVTDSDYRISLGTGSKVIPIVGVYHGWPTSFFTQASYESRCVISDGMGGGIYKDGGVCSLAWRIDGY